MKGTIKENREFQYAYRRGKKAVNRLLVVHGCKNRTGENRVGITVSKQLGNAVVRNRVKRLIREAYRSMHIPKQGYNIVVVARGAMAGATFGRTCSALKDGLERVELL